MKVSIVFVASEWIKHGPNHLTAKQHVAENGFVMHQEAGVRMIKHDISILY